MSVKTLSWIVLAAITAGLVLLFNYWASYQLLSTLVYAGIVAALLGLANLVRPFRFMGVRKRAVGLLVLLGGLIVTLAALYWPAGVNHVAQHRTRLDDIMPEYQFSETHSARIHAPRDRVLEAVRQSTFGDMKSLVSLLKVRAAVLRLPSNETGVFVANMRILDAFIASGYVSGSSDNEILMAGGANLIAKGPLRPRTLQEFADDREPGVIKIGYNFKVVETGDGWSNLTAETRMAASDQFSRGAARYWRLIVPGSGLLRRQWLGGIKHRAESAK